MVCISPSSRPWERPVRSERVNMTTVGVTSGVFSIGAALPLSARFRLSVGGGHPEDSVALQTQWARTCRNSLHTFKCTNQVLPPVTLNHALQRSCSTDTRTVQRMDLCRLSSTPIQPWHQLTEPLWLFSGPKTTLWWHHAQRGGAATSYFLCETQASEQCMLGNSSSAKAFGKLQLLLEEMKDEKREVCV